MDVNTQPPRVSVDRLQHYVNQGGAELVTFTVSGSWTEAGVRVGQYTFRSFPLPGRPANERFSIFAFPWNEPVSTVPVVYASNPSGAEAKGHFWCKVFPKTSARAISISAINFSTKLWTKSTRTALATNSPASSRSTETCGGRTIRPSPISASRPARSSYGPARSGATARPNRSSPIPGIMFTRARWSITGPILDSICPISRISVVAANDGQVVFTGNLGSRQLFVVDHGYGLQSIYGHLSEMA